MIFLKTYKPLIFNHLKELLQNMPPSLPIENIWKEDVSKRLIALSENGKMARGSFFLFSCEMFGLKHNKDLLNIAAALEIIHASLLIHDDIMDNDRIRRNQETMFVQYENMLKKEHDNDAESTGKSLAICVGDIGFFLANTYITSSKISNDLKSELIQLISHELIQVGFAQMTDCVNKVGSTDSENEILSLYKYKTGRYTFSLPCVMAAKITNQNHKIIETLSELGENVGILFQIQDELLGLFGTEEKLGKPIGSDIREDRKTLYKTYLYQDSTVEEKHTLNSLFDNKSITEKDVDFIRNIVRKKGIDKKIAKLVENYHNKSLVLIKELPVDVAYKTQLEELITFVTNRVN